MAQDLATEFVAELYRRERSGMARSVARIAGESHAEDLVHDAFVAYLTKAPWADRPGAWVATVARNRALNELRRPKIVPLSGQEPAAERATPEAEREAVRGVVASALEALPERSLVALRMKFFDGAEYAQIAEALGVRVAQAHVIVHRALRRLGRELIRSMAEAHGASGCVPALVKLAGLGGGDSASHESGPCPVCRPAWDEIVALRIGGWLPLPLIAFKDKIRDLGHKIAGRITVRGTLAAEPVSRAATAFVALGVAASSLAPTAAAIPSASQRTTSNVVRSAAGTSVDAPDRLAPASAADRAPAPAAPRAPRQQESRTTSLGGSSHVTPPQHDGSPGQVSNDGVGGVLVCTDLSQPCPPPPAEPGE